MPNPLKLAIIGAGLAGRTFAAACAAAGHQVTLEDVMPHKLRHAEDLLTDHFTTLGAQAKYPVRMVQSVEDAVVDVDLVVDFVPDELESKLEIFSLLDRMAPPRTILLTPSDTLSVTDLASCTYRADRVLMFRGTDPVRLLLTRDTAGEVTRTVSAFLQSLGNQSPGNPSVNDHVAIEYDPDLPQLMKNMNLPAGSRL